jgi:hypothetical protein
MMKRSKNTGRRRKITFISPLYCQFYTAVSGNRKATRWTAAGWTVRDVIDATGDILQQAGHP